MFRQAADRLEQPSMATRWPMVHARNGDPIFHDNAWFAILSLVLLAAFNISLYLCTISTLTKIMTFLDQHVGIDVKINLRLLVHFSMKNHIKYSQLGSLKHGCFLT